MIIKLFKISAGFTLVELMVAIAILGIIGSIGLVSYSNIQKYTRDIQRKQNLASIGLALERYYAQNDNTYPAGPADSGNVNIPTPAAWSNLLTNFMKNMPNDPSTNLYYYRRSSETNYVLCATLELESDKDLPANQNPPKSMDSNCPEGTNYFIDTPF